MTTGKDPDPVVGVPLYFLELDHLTTWSRSFDTMEKMVCAIAFDVYTSMPYARCAPRLCGNEE